MDKSNSKHQSFLTGLCRGGDTHTGALHRTRVDLRMVMWSDTLAALIETDWAAQASQLTGTWNVTSVETTDYTCKNSKPGSTQANIWIVSSQVSGLVTVSVQGETSFPKLQGRLSQDGKILTLTGDSP